MKLSLFNVILVGTGGILVYSGVKDYNPIDVVKHALGGEPPQKMGGSADDEAPQPTEPWASGESGLPERKRPQEKAAGRPRSERAEEWPYNPGLPKSEQAERWLEPIIVPGTGGGSGGGGGGGGGGSW